MSLNDTIAEIEANAEIQKVVDAAPEPNPFDALVAENDKSLDELNRANVDVTSLLLRLRLEVAIELLLPSSGPLRQTFELFFQRNLKDVIAGALEEANRGKLLAP